MASRHEIQRLRYLLWLAVKRSGGEIHIPEKFICNNPPTGTELTTINRWNGDVWIFADKKHPK